MKAELRKLKIENSELTKKTTQACGNARYMEVIQQQMLTHFTIKFYQNQALVGLADRAELKRRLEKAENQVCA